MHSFFAAASSMLSAQFFSKNSRMLLLFVPPIALAFQAEYVPAGSVWTPKITPPRGELSREAACLSMYNYTHVSVQTAYY